MEHYHPFLSFYQVSILIKTIIYNPVFLKSLSYKLS